VIRKSFAVNGPVGRAAGSADAVEVLEAQLVEGLEGHAPLRCQVGVASGEAGMGPDPTGKLTCREVETP
jgi:hypothetical protein